MKTWDDGHVGISLERVSSILRIHSAVPEGAHPPFTGSGTLVGIGESSAKVVGLRCDELSRAHLRLIASAMLDEGIETLIADRAEGHSLPFARRIMYGPLEGWLELDLVAARLSALRRGR